MSAKLHLPFIYRDGKALSKLRVQTHDIIYYTSRSLKKQTDAFEDLELYHAGLNQQTRSLAQSLQTQKSQVQMPVDIGRINLKIRVFARFLMLHLNLYNIYTAITSHLYRLLSLFPDYPQSYLWYKYYI